MESTLNREQGFQYHEGYEAEVMQIKATVDNGDSPSNTSPLMNHTIPAAPTCSAMSYISHPFPTFPTQDFCRSFIGILSAFPTQILSTSSLWPSEEMDSSSMEAIVAATVAAASAWWATNGLIPLFLPVHPSAFPFSPPPATSFHVANTAQSPQEKMETYKNSSTADQEAVQSSSSSSNLKKIENNYCNSKPLSDVAYHNLGGAKMSNNNERSSCGSNATSSSEIETDAVLEKNGKTKDEAQQSQFQNLSVGEFNTRRPHSSLCFNETWKEVSHEGLLAFQAHFARDILPQSFATQLDKPKMGLLKEDEIKHGNIKV